MKQQISEVLNCEQADIYSFGNGMILFIDKTVKLGKSTIEELKYLSIRVTETPLFYYLIQR